jgi:hypothetical protein
MKLEDLTAVALLLEQAISRMPPVPQAVEHPATLRILQGLEKLQAQVLRQRDLQIRKAPPATGRG